MKLKAIFLILITLSPSFLSAQVRESLSWEKETGSFGLNKSFKQGGDNYTDSYIAPAAFVGFGFLSLDSRLIRKFDSNLNSEIREDYSHFSTNADDYLQYAPIATAYGLSAAGIKGKNNFVDRTAMLMISNVSMRSSVSFLKKETHRLRPNGSNYNSFPSGHTAQAFVGAEFLAQEYGDVSPWYSVAGYTLASATGTLRMFNNRHWFSDVVAGAGIGILSVKLSYIVYPYLKEKIWKDRSPNFIVIPTYQEGLTGFTLIKGFK